MLRTTAGLLLLVGLIAGCSDAGGPTPTPPLITPQLAIVQGEAQTDTVMRTLPIELAARLTDKATGDPLPGRIVNWVVIEGGGTVFAAVTQTGSDGVARQPWTLGPTAGSQRLVARWVDPETGEPVTLDTARATAVPAPAATAFALPDRDSIMGGDTLFVEYGYRDAWGNPTWAGCEAPDSVGWNWVAELLGLDSIIGGMGTTNPNTGWAMFAPVVIGDRRYVRFYIPDRAQPLGLRAYNRCLDSIVNAPPVSLWPRPD